MEKINLMGGNQADCQYSDDDILKLQVERMNEAPGNLKGYHCDKCNDKGFIYTIVNGALYGDMCDCMSIRNLHSRIQQSGLSNLIDKYTFEKYTTDKDWQKSVKRKAEDFVNEDYPGWFFIGGQVGAGKTHICTAMAGEYIKKKKAVRYMVWIDEIPSLNAIVNNAEEYQQRMQNLKTAPVLYIDDFFRVENGQSVTPAEIKRAFELLNYRYNNPELITIISSQLTIREITGISEAVGSRINERSTNYQININPDVKKNYRLK